MADLVDLDRYNYTMIGEGTAGWISILNSTPYTLKGKVSVLQNIYIKNPLRHLSRKETVLELAGRNRVAVMRLWHFAIGSANQLNHLFETGMVCTYLKKKCYVGEELIPSHEAIFNITPPGSLAMGRIQQQFMSSGIWFRWIQEIMWLEASPRVQDRVRILSPTKILDEKGVQIESVK